MPHRFILAFLFLACTPAERPVETVPAASVRRADAPSSPPLTSIEPVVEPPFDLTLSPDVLRLVENRLTRPDGTVDLVRTLEHTPGVDTPHAASPIAPEVVRRILRRASLALGFTIARDGTVRAVSVRGEPPGGHGLASCAATVVDALRFPNPSGRDVRVLHAITLKPA